MKVKYIQPEISIFTVYGKEFIMEDNMAVVNGSKGTTAGQGNGQWEDDETKRRDAFDDKDITYGNIW
jgi:hypothetical protein